MAFKLQNLGLASLSFNQANELDPTGEIVGAPRLFTYRSATDTLAQIQDPAYFDGTDNIIATGDVIIINGIDGVGMLSFITIDIEDFDTTNVLDITAAGIADGAVTVPKLAPDTLAYFLQVANNLSDLSNVSTARLNLGLGSAALMDVTDFLRPPQNLADVQSKTISFNNISPVTTKGDLIVGNGANSNTRLAVGADTYVLTANSATATGLEWAPSGSGPVGPANQVVQDINQVAHGFSVENILTTSGGVYVLAQANNLANSQVVGMVIDVIDADNFTILIDGYISGLSAKTASTTYYLSQTTAGLLTSTEPTTAGQISRPLLRTDGTTSGYFFLGRSNFTTATFLQSANNLSDLNSASTARTNLGLGTAAVQNATFFLQVANNLSDLTNAATARTNLGLGTMAVVNSPVPVANGGTGQTSAGATAANAIGALAIANNLSDVANVTTSRTNLGAAASATTLTVNGTANEVTVTGGTQDISANRTWTASLPTSLTFIGKTVSGGTYSGATATTFTFSTGSIGTAVTGVTQTALDNSTKIATTAYVDSAVTAGAGASTNATYITQTPNGTLSNEQALSALSTGIMKSTTGTGVVSIAAQGTDYYAPGGTDVAVADGGTGVSSLTAYAVICGGTTSTGAVQSIASVGTSGQVLMSNGAAALPTMQTFTNLQSQIIHSGIVTTSDITTDQNDYNPPGLSGAATLKLTAVTNNVTITGLQGGTSGRILTIYGSNSQTITLANGSASSLAANRFYFPGLGTRDFVLSASGDDSVTFIYDGTINNWVWMNGIGKPGTNVGFTSSGILSALAVTTSPAQITSNQNNYAISTVSGNTPNQIRLSSDASRDITGISASSSQPGRILILMNVGSNNIVLKDQSGSSTSGNQFLFGADLTLTPNATATIQYDATTLKWRLMATTVSTAVTSTVNLGLTYLVSNSIFSN